MNKLLVLQQVYFRYQKRLLQGIDIALAAGERLTLLGFNGAGKSTLLKLMAGQVPWQRGQLFWQGEALAPWRLRTAFFRQQIGFAAENLSTIPDWSVVDYLSYASALLKISGRRQRVNALLKTFDLLPFAKTACRQLSTGTFKRLLLAQACLSQPKLLLLDEPTAGLDFQQRQQFFDLIKQLDSAIIFTTHQLNEVTLLTQRSLFLQQGQVFALPALDFSLPYYRLAWHKPPSLVELQAVLADVAWQNWQCSSDASGLKSLVLPLSEKNLSLIQKFAEAWGLCLLTPLTAKDWEGALQEWLNSRVSS